MSIWSLTKSGLEYTQHEGATSHKPAYAVRTSYDRALSHPTQSDEEGVLFWSVNDTEKSG